VATQGGWEGLCGAEESCHAGAHLAQSVEDAIQDNEERKNCLDRPMAPPRMNPRMAQRKKPRAMVCLRPILSMRNPPTMQPGR
jgi:hypothetical protein